MTKRVSCAAASTSRGVHQCHTVSRARARAAGSHGSYDDESMQASRPVARAISMLSRRRSSSRRSVQGRVSCCIRAEKGAVDGRFIADATWALVGRGKGEEGPRRDARRGKCRSSGRRWRILWLAWSA